MERKEALQKAIDEISRQRAEITRLRQGIREPIAIVGMACRLPSAPTLDDYWTLLARGGDAVTEVPRARWDADRYFDADPSVVGKMATRQGAFVANVDQFDPQFFGISPREAARMDPQQRWALEVAWEAIEDAGSAAHALTGAMRLGHDLGPEAVIVIKLSGRGDKDMATAARWFGLDPVDEAAEGR